jgi:hypothetical protein
MAMTSLLARPRPGGWRVAAGANIRAAADLLDSYINRQKRLNIEETGQRTLATLAAVCQGRRHDRASALR